MVQVVVVEAIDDLLVIDLEVEMNTLDLEEDHVCHRHLSQPFRDDFYQRKVQPEPYDHI